MKDSDMEDRSSKLYTGLCVLVLIWIGVYWAWEPGESTKPRISISTPELVQEPVEDSTAEIDDEPEQSSSQQLLILPDPESAKPDPVEVDPSPRLIPPEFRNHTVVQGEIMQDIAEKYYGKSSMWNVIARANPRVDPLKLREGMTLRIPVDPDNIQGIVDSGSDPDQPNSANQQEQAVVDYIVQSGDSLSLIAQRFYGSSRYADFIYESNRDRLRSKDAIRVGQTLKLPPLDP
jgi:LysM repeat protein